MNEKFLSLMVLFLGILVFASMLLACLEEDGGACFADADVSIASTSR